MSIESHLVELVRRHQALERDVQVDIRQVVQVGVADDQPVWFGVGPSRRGRCAPALLMRLA